MGNNQSNTNNTNKKIKVFKIIRTQENSGWTRAYLNDYVNYSDGNYKHIDFKTSTLQDVGMMASSIFSIEKPEWYFPIVKGQYIGIDIDEVKQYSSNNNFFQNQVKNIGMEYENSDGEIVFMANGREPESRKFIDDLGDLIKEVTQIRERRAYLEQLHYEQVQERLNPWFDLPPNGR